MDPPDTSEAIAILGMDGRFPGAADLDRFRAQLLSGEEAITFFSDAELEAAGVDPGLLADPAYVKAAGVLEDADRFDARFFGFSPREAEILDPQHRLFLQCAWRALEDAGCDPGRFDGRIGVFAGSGLPSYLLRHVHPRRELVETVGAYQAVLGNDKDFLATRVSYKLDLRGPSLTVQTACSTSLVAVSLACQSLMSGECDAALAGGVALRLPQVAGYFYQEDGILSPDGHCRAFDAASRGTVPGSGVGVVVLRRLDDALADGDPIRAVVRGWAVNNDGAGKAGYTAPSVEGQAEVIRDALALAGVEPETLTYVEAHGTGTPLGDPIEVAALTQAFGASSQRKGFCALGSVKTNLGHLDAAAGVAGLIKTVLALEAERLPPSLHFEHPNPKLQLEGSPFYVCREAVAWETAGRPRRAGVSSFGIGGTNAHVVLEEAPRPEAAAADPRPWHLLLLSAGSERALAARTEALADHLRHHPALSLADAAYTLHAGRRPLEHRRFAVCRDLEDAVAVLSGGESRRLATDLHEAGHRPVAFLFPGQGSQHPGMAADLYHHEPLFRRQLDHCAELLAPHLPLSAGGLLRVIFPPEEDAGAAQRLRQTELAQPTLFAVSYALARLWMEWGVRPEAMVGHSVGELVAACLAGVMALEEALELVAARGRLMQTLPPGAMLSVPLSEAEVLPLLGEELSVAAVNGESITTVSGSPEAVESLERRLVAQGRPGRRLATSHAFHSAIVEPILEAFRERVSGIELRPPQIPFLSNLTGTWITPEQATDAGYWTDLLRQPVRFAPAVRELLDEPRRVLLEVGPGEVLSSLVRQQPEARGRTVVTSLPHPQDPASDLETLLSAVGRLWLGGVEVEAGAFFRHRGCRKLRLPAYPFEGERFWVEAQPADTASAGAIADPAARKPDPADWFYLPTWKRTLPASALAVGEPGSGMEPQDVLWLLLADELELGERLAVRLRERGAEVSTAAVGEGFERLGDGAYRVRPGSPEDFESLVSSLPGDGSRTLRVVSLWGVVTPPAGSRSGSRPTPDLLGLLHLAQALRRLRPGGETRFALVTNGLHEVLGGEAFAPERAAAGGLARVLPQELAGATCRSLDLEWPQGDGDGAVERLLDELTSSAPAPCVALRGRHRWEQVFEPLRLEAPGEAAPSLLRPEGHYVITGGLGRFGTAIARHLAEHHRARVTLLDRREAPGGDAVLAPGAEVVAVQVDVTDRERLVEALSAACARWGPPDGVIHAAGAPADFYKSVLELTAGDLEAHLGPKLGGAAVLQEALAEALGEASPGFCLGVSSLTPLLGGVGLAPFAVADAALDAFSGLAGGEWLSVNWEGWGGLGEEGAVLPGLPSNPWILQPEEVPTVLERSLRLAGQGRLVAATGDLTVRLARSLAASGAGAPGGSGAPSAGRRDAGVPYRAPGNAVESRIAEVWQQVLGVDQIGVDDDFFLLGGSSLAGLQILSTLRGEFDVELPLASFFEARSVGGMAAAIEEERQRGEADEARLAEILAAIEAMPDEDVESVLNQEGGDG